MATYASWIVLQILLEAGLPAGVIQFLPCVNGQETINLVEKVIAHRLFAGLHFTGSTAVFKSLWKAIANNIESYLSYPRIVGETDKSFSTVKYNFKRELIRFMTCVSRGKNWQLVHPSADVRAAVIAAIRGAYEYQGGSIAASRSFPSRAGVLMSSHQAKNVRPCLVCMFPDHCGRRQVDSRRRSLLRWVRSPSDLLLSLVTSWDPSCELPLSSYAVFCENLN